MRKELAMAAALTFASNFVFATDAALPAADRAVPGAEKSRPDAIGHSSTQYQSVDADGDGYLSQTEAQANSAINFSELDADKDGKLSMQELTDAQRKAGAAGRSGDAERGGSVSGERGSAGGGASPDVQK